MVRVRGWLFGSIVLGAACGGRHPLGGEGAGGSAAPAGASGSTTAGANGSTTGGAGVSAPTGSAGAGGAPAGGAGEASADAGGESHAPPPGAFTLTSPEDTPLMMSPPMFTWTASAGAASYDVDVSTSESFDVASTTTKTGLTGPSFPWPSPLTPGQVFFWRVTAVADGARTVASNGPFWMSAPVGAGPSPHGVAVTRDGLLLVANQQVGLTVVNLNDLASAPVFLYQGSTNLVAASPNGKLAYLTWGSKDTVTIVDLSSGAAVGGVDTPCKAFVYGLALTPDGRTLVMPDIAADCQSNVLDIVATATPSLLRQVPLGDLGQPYGVAVTPDGASALVAHGNVKRVDLASGVVTPIAGMGDPGAGAIAVTADGKTAWAGEESGAQPIDLATNTAGPAIAYGLNDENCNIAVTPDGRTGVVSGDWISAGHATVAVLDLAARKVAKTYPVAARCVAITPDGTRAFVTAYAMPTAPSMGMVYVLKLP